MMLKPFFAPVIAGAFFLVGCGPSLMPAATASLSCSEEQIESDSMGMGMHVKGCGKEDLFLFDYNQGTWVSLRERAAFEFSCEKEQVKMTILDSMTFGVEGCGNKAVYKTVPYQGFVMNSSSSDAGKSGPGGSAPPKEAPAEPGEPDGKSL